MHGDCGAAIAPGAVAAAHITERIVYVNFLCDDLLKVLIIVQFRFSEHSYYHFFI